MRDWMARLRAAAYAADPNWHHIDRHPSEPAWRKNRPRITLRPTAAPPVSALRRTADNLRKTDAVVNRHGVLSLTVLNSRLKNSSSTISSCSVPAESGHVGNVPHAFQQAAKYLSDVFGERHQKLLTEVGEGSSKSKRSTPPGKCPKHASQTIGGIGRSYCNAPAGHGLSVCGLEFDILHRYAG